jgi:hypothetical protein
MPRAPKSRAGHPTTPRRGGGRRIPAAIGGRDGARSVEADPLAIVPGSIPPEAEGTAIPHVERPHSQAVCRSCGRILEVALALDELKLLADLADRVPKGWRVDGMSFTLMGVCRPCRENPRKPSGRR